MEYYIVPKTDICMKVEATNEIKAIKYFSEERVPDDDYYFKAVPVDEWEKDNNK